jgi:hypothetical protein
MRTEDKLVMSDDPDTVPQDQLVTEMYIPIA